MTCAVYCYGSNNSPRRHRWRGQRLILAGLRSDYRSNAAFARINDNLLHILFSRLNPAKAQSPSQGFGFFSFQGNHKKIRNSNDEKIPHPHPWQRQSSTSDFTSPTPCSCQPILKWTRYHGSIYLTAPDPRFDHEDCL